MCASLTLEHRSVLSLWVGRGGEGGGGGFNVAELDHYSWL